MKVCPKCNNANPDNASFCNYCGNNISSPAPQPEQPMAHPDNNPVPQQPVYPNSYAPQQPMYPPAAGPQKKKSKTGKILIIVLAVVVVFLLGILAAVISGSRSHSYDNTSALTTVNEGDNDINANENENDGDVIADNDDGGEEEASDEEPPTRQIDLLSNYLRKTPVRGKLEKEYYYTEYFDFALDLDVFDKQYIYFITFSGYQSAGTEKNADGSTKYIYVKDGNHKIEIYNGENESWVSYQNVYTSGVRYDENGNKLPETYTKPAKKNSGSSSSSGSSGSGSVYTTVPSATTVPSVTKQKSRMCPSCHGTRNCSTCNGSGIVRNPYVLGEEKLCPTCNGGKLCTKCNGTGEIS